MKLPDIFGITNVKEQRTQLYFRDDGGFHFRKLDIEDGFLVEKNARKEIVKAWILRYKLLKNFTGYGHIAADKLTLSYARDIIFDPFSQLEGGEKLTKGEELKKDFVRKIAEAKCYKHEHEAKGNQSINKIIMFEGVVMVILALVMFI